MFMLPIREYEVADTRLRQWNAVTDMHRPGRPGALSAAVGTCSHTCSRRGLRLAQVKVRVRVRVRVRVGMSPYLFPTRPSFGTG